MNLYRQTYELELLTPAWVSGADPHSAEIRVPTLRGQLRFWMRRLYPGKSRDQEILGHAGKDAPSASSVVLRLLDWSGSTGNQNLEDYTGKKGTDATSDPEGYFLWPLRPSEKSQQKRAVVHPDKPGKNATFTVETQWRLLTSSQKESFMPHFQRAWEAFSLLGAIGTRSTRGYGGVWPRGLDLRDAADFASRLEFLPSSVVVRLLEGDFDESRAAIAHSAEWFRSLRLGTSRFGGTPSSWGCNDHDVALKPTHDSHLHRPVLGMPLTQRYKNGPTLQTKYEWKNPETGETNLNAGDNSLTGDCYGRKNPETGETNLNDRYPSPVRIKVVRMGGYYRVALVILRDQILPENTQLSIEGGNHRGSGRSWVSLDLINHIANEGESIH